MTALSEARIVPATKRGAVQRQVIARVAGRGDKTRPVTR